MVELPNNLYQERLLQWTLRKQPAAQSKPLSPESNSLTQIQLKRAALPPEQSLKTAELPE